ncbi:MAG: ABC transporter permease [Chloroflexi bacterium]|nr:ABC transporter permease [Chloroflexota bacterium]
MATYILSRLVQAIFVIVGIMMMTFFLLQVTGDPARAMVPPEAGEEAVIAIRQRLGLDRPLPIQFATYMAGAIRGDFGASLSFNVPASELVLERFPATLQLALAAMVWSLSFSLVLGIISAVRRHRAEDFAATTIALLGQSVPTFWMGIMLILLFGVTLGWLPTSGKTDWTSFVLPAITLGSFTMARTTRLVRSGMLEVLGQDYIRTARAKGLSEWVVIVQHALRNAAIPIVTIVGLDFGTLLGGAVITETIFAWPGVGRLAVEAIFRRDFPLVQADIFYIASVFVLVNLFVDLLYTGLDPRVRLG